ncbi:MAG: CBS domain-containing protein [Deltaproteobacteria bacterium]|nr:CBS domain-containing protein [Deltaproteobacteria bacterium]
MSIGEICIREVVIAKATDSIHKAAQLMRDYSVRTVIITENRHPIGILTDRDITIRVVAEGNDPHQSLVKDVMSARLLTVRESASVGDGIRIMRGRGIRRLPVIDQQGKLVGMVTLDDLIDLLAEEMSALAGLIRYEQEKEKQK